MQQVKKLLIILGVFICSITWAQNLVPNYSFEEIDTCPTGVTPFSNAVNWFSPSPATPDVYNSCVTIINGFDVPDNFFGFQHANEGIGYSGLVLYFPNDREYIGTKLLDSLKINTYYCLSFFVSLSHSYRLSCSSIGAFFSPDSIYANTTNVLPYFPQIENPDTDFINDTAVWKPITGYFKAQGGEKYMYIGNFRNDANTVTQNFTPGAKSYVYIDNVQLYECDSLIGVEENKIEQIKIYPNPAQDFVSIDIPKNYSHAQLSIYNLTGQLVATKPIQSNQNIPVTELGNGMYIFVVQTGDKIWRERVVVRD